jgi:hypothetical protein
MERKWESGRVGEWRVGEWRVGEWRVGELDSR